MGVTAHVLFYFIDGRMIMATYTLESLLNTTDGMAKVNEYVIQEKTLEVEGAAWYHYAGNTINKLYISGKGYIGFGTDVELSLIHI